LELVFQPVIARLPSFWLGLQTTVGISLAAIALSLVLGLGLALARNARLRPVRWLAVVYIDLFRNTPFLVQLFFFYFGLPAIGIALDAVTTGILALALSTATGAGEVIRAGINSVPQASLDAARSFGLNRLEQLRHVVLPIAFRFAIRPLGNVFVNLVLTTSLLSTITINDLMSRGETVASDTFRPFEVYLLVLLLYWLVTFAVSLAVNLVSGGWLRRSSDRLAVH
jgi:polar amino acid transport system permease protein/putative glutamine transport system permease protein